MKNITKEDLKLLREIYINNYCKEKGWDPKNLKPSQMLEIVSNKNYISPKIDPKK